MPANRKRPDQRQNNRPDRAPLEVVVPVVAPPAPAPDRGWRKATKDAWVAYWASDVAAAAQDVDLPSLRRLFTMLDTQAQCWARYTAQPYVDGSKGQPVSNPALDDALKLERAVVALEDRLGLSPKARANLAISIGQAQLTAADLNAMAKEDDADRHEDAIEAELAAEWSDAQAN